MGIIMPDLGMRVNRIATAPANSEWANRNQLAVAG